MWRDLKQRSDRNAFAERRGAMIMLIAVGLIILLAMVAFTVDVAYMQLVRTELRAATDAAARAAVENLRRTRDDKTAIAAAVDVAARNRVAGAPLALTPAEVKIGRATRQTDHSWLFEPGQKPYTAVRVDARMAPGTAAGAVDLFFGKVLGVKTFQPAESATAAYTDMDIVLCLDRSHSMCFDLSGTDWKYPAGIPALPDSLKYPPHATKSRWAVLNISIASFVNIVKQNNPAPRVGLVTWASDITTSSYEYSITKMTSPKVALDVSLTTTYSQITSSLSARGTKPVLGGTDMSAGLDEAVRVMLAQSTKPYTARTIILLTDGQWNQGRDPILSARDAKAAGIVVHTIGMLSGSDATTLSRIATETGGRSYVTQNQAQLTAAFEELARLLPVVLTN